MNFQLSEEEEETVRAVKSHLHRHPEKSWHEFETTKFITQFLERIPGIEILPTGLKTGVVAYLKGAKPGKCAALRADIDALEVVECWESPDKSQNEGRGHLCGHDFHTASLLGAAMILSRHRSELAGNVIFIFQPAEETTNGARVVIKTGIFEKYAIDAIFGLHNRPEIETGRVVVQTGSLMAAKINFRILVHGIGGHGSMPHKCVDPLVGAAAIIQNVLTIPSRNVDPMKSLVLSICSVHGGTPDNLIVSEVEMTGSMRYHDPDVGMRALERLKTVVNATCQTFECTSDFEIVESVPAVINHESLYETALEAARDAIGPDAPVASQSALATEDFADYMQIVPGFFYWLGSRKPGDEAFAWHNSRFHTDDNAIRLGSQLLAASAQRFLEKSIHSDKT